MRLNTNTNTNFGKNLCWMRCAGMRHEVNLWTHKNRWAHAAQFVYPQRDARNIKYEIRNTKYEIQNKNHCRQLENFEKRRRIRCDLLLCDVTSIRSRSLSIFDFDTYLCALYIRMYMNVDHKWIWLPLPLPRWPLGCWPKRLKTIAAIAYSGSGWVISPLPLSLSLS